MRRGDTEAPLRVRLPGVLNDSVGIQGYDHSPFGLRELKKLLDKHWRGDTPCSDILEHLEWGAATRQCIGRWCRAPRHTWQESQWVLAPRRVAITAGSANQGNTVDTSDGKENLGRGRIPEEEIKGLMLHHSARAGRMKCITFGSWVPGEILVRHRRRENHLACGR